MSNHVTKTDLTDLRTASRPKSQCYATNPRRRSPKPSCASKANIEAARTDLLNRVFALIFDTLVVNILVRPIFAAANLVSY